jgi:thymidylate synthase ThyX
MRAVDLLPAAALSNVGIYGSGQAFEMMLLRMRAHPLPEARSYADLMLTELRKVIPSFLKRVDLADRGGAVDGIPRDHPARPRSSLVTRPHRCTRIRPSFRSWGHVDRLGP